MDDEGAMPQCAETVKEVIDVAVVEIPILHDAADQDRTATGSAVHAGASMRRRRHRWSEGI